MIVVDHCDIIGFDKYYFIIAKHLLSFYLIVVFYLFLALEVQHHDQVIMGLVGIQLFINHQTPTTQSWMEMSTRQGGHKLFKTCFS